MWKRLFFLAVSTTFFPQKKNKKGKTSQQGKSANVSPLLFHRKFLHIPQPLCIIFCVGATPGRPESGPSRTPAPTFDNQRSYCIVGAVCDRPRANTVRPYNFQFSTFNCPLSTLYRQELILAVISRIWFCRAVLPAFSSDSTFLMELSTVVWSLPPNSLPISGVDRLVRFRIR